MTLKRCNWCHQEKGLHEFNARKQSTDGLQRHCRICASERDRDYRAKNRETRPPKQQQWRKSHYAANKASYYESNAKRRAKLVSSDELTEFVYEEAVQLRKSREDITGFKWHIDHIVPLHHKDVCGLHTACNFQVVPASWNLTKNNLNMDTYFYET